MWLQVELPAPVTLTEMQFTSSTIGGGRGGAGAVDVSAGLPRSGLVSMDRRGARLWPRARASPE